MKRYAALISGMVVLALIPMPLRVVAQTPDETKKDTSKKSTDKKKTEEKKETPTPKIDSAAAQVLTLGMPQKLIVSGSDFAEGATVKLTAPSGSQTVLASSQVKRVSATQMEVSATFGEEGDWQIAIQNPGGATAATQSLKVAAAAPDPKAVAAYQSAAGMVRALLAVALLLIVIALTIAAARGRWSLGDALSEEAGVQPPSVTAAGQVKMVASSSRLIALLGLVGILIIILGVGDAVTWRLFIYGSVPDLAGLRNFLFGCACLFAPYLANQLRGVFSDRAASAPAEAGGAEQESAASITSVVPTDVTAGAARDVRLTGTGFQKGVSVTLTNPANVQQTITGANVHYLSPSLVGVTADLNQPGGWKVTVQNPKAGASSPFLFTVLGAPEVGGVIPQQPASGAPRSLTVHGVGFIPTPTVVFTPPAAPAGTQPQNGNVTKVEENRLVVEVTFPVGGQWQVVVTNPGGPAAAPFASAAFNITVT